MLTLGYKMQRDEQGIAYVSEDIVGLTSEARRLGVYVIGTTGTGKTTLLQSIAYQDMEAGDGLCVIDPHGDMIDKLLLRVPQERMKDVILFDPGNKDQFDRPLGLNLFDCDRNDPRERRSVAAAILDTLYKLYSYSWGPRMEYLLRNSILTLLEKPDTTLFDLWLLLASKKHRSGYIADAADPVLQHFWNLEFPLYEANSRDLADLVGSSLNKIGRFLTDPVIRNLVVQPHSSFNLSQIMNEGKILLVNLSKGELGEDNSALLGAVLVNQALIAALRRRSIEPEQRRPFHLIVDEYQNFAISSFPTLQSEARKYAIDVIVAHQYRDQLDDLNKGSTLNVANFIVMRVSGRDSFELASQFDNTPAEQEMGAEARYVWKADRRGQKYLVQARESDNKDSNVIYQLVQKPRRAYSDVQAETANDLATLHHYQAVCRIFEDRIPHEYTIETIPPEVAPQLHGTPNAEVSTYIRRRWSEQGMEQTEIERRVLEIGKELDFGIPMEARGRGHGIFSEG